MSDNLTFPSTGAPATGAQHGRALVGAKAVAWALTAITGAALLLGLAVVEFLGRPPAPELERDPAQAPKHEARTQHEKPIILQSAATTQGDDAPDYPPRRDAPARYEARDTSPSPGVR